jgi:hypothetical protein
MAMQTSIVQSIGLSQQTLEVLIQRLQLQGQRKLSILSLLDQ